MYLKYTAIATIVIILALVVTACYLGNNFERLKRKILQ